MPHVIKLQIPEKPPRSETKYASIAKQMIRKVSWIALCAMYLNRLSKYVRRNPKAAPMSTERIQREMKLPSISNPLETSIFSSGCYWYVWTV